MRNSFIDIENLFSGKKSGPAMLEFSIEQTLCEQLIWRRGAHLWRNEDAALETLSEGFRLSHLGAVVLPLSRMQERQGYPILDVLRDKLPAPMGMICGPKAGPAARVGSGEDPEQAARSFLMAAAALAEKADVIFIQDDFSAAADEGLRREMLGCLESACEAAHQRGRKIIWVDRSEKPLPIEQIARLPFDGLWLSEQYPFITEDAIRQFGERFCLLGRTDFSRLLTLKPMDIIRDFAALWERCGGKGYIFGSGNLDSRPIPYLTFLSMLSALDRLK